MSLAAGIILLSTLRQGQHQRLDLNICIIMVLLKMNENENALHSLCTRCAALNLFDQMVNVVLIAQKLSEWHSRQYTFVNPVAHFPHFEAQVWLISLSWLKIDYTMNKKITNIPCHDHWTFQNWLMYRPAVLFPSALLKTSHCYTLVQGFWRCPCCSIWPHWGRLSGLMYFWGRVRWCRHNIVTWELTWELGLLHQQPPEHTTDVTKVRIEQMGVIGQVVRHGPRICKSPESADRIFCPGSGQRYLYSM